MKYFALTIMTVVALIVQQPVAAADQSFEKPLFLMVFDKTCHAWCEKVRPMVKELKEQYGDQIDFGELDTTQELLTKCKQDAKQLGVLGSLPDFVDWVPCCAVFGKKRNNVLKEVSGPKSKEVYDNLVKLAVSKK